MSKQNQKNKTTSRSKAKAKAPAKHVKRVRDTEASAEEVLHEEVFPAEHRANKRRSCGCGCGEHKRKCGCDNPSEPKRGKTAHACAGKENPSTTKKCNGTRPTRKGYKMIDPSDEQADNSKS